MAFVRAATQHVPTLFVGDGINDAQALASATVGVAFGGASNVTSQAASAVILEPSLGKIDELLHLGIRLRQIALQSAVGGLALSVLGMLATAFGYLLPLYAALFQEAIDIAAILNALRTQNGFTAQRPRKVSFMSTAPSPAVQASATLAHTSPQSASETHRPQTEPR